MQYKSKLKVSLIFSLLVILLGCAALFIFTVEGQTYSTASPSPSNSPSVSGFNPGAAGQQLITPSPSIPEFPVVFFAWVFALLVGGAAAIYVKHRINNQSGN